jgi:predicted ABC-type ATPase
MTRPEMYVVAGPPGAGKSTAFSLLAFAGRVFNADDRAAQLNGSSYRAIPRSIRRLVNTEFETFVLENTANRQSFALETTLRSRVTFEQARFAKSEGFQVFMIYVALETFELHLERVTRRASAGGHSASEATLRNIYDCSGQITELPDDFPAWLQTALRWSDSDLSTLRETIARRRSESYIFGA